MTDDERRWALGNTNRPERYLRVQTCPFRRPHIGPPGPKYYIELNLARPEDRDTPVCQSPWSWIARQLQ
jgi:hypothetical protein